MHFSEIKAGGLVLEKTPSGFSLKKDGKVTGSETDFNVFISALREQAKESIPRLSTTDTPNQAQLNTRGAIANLNLSRSA